MCRALPELECELYGGGCEGNITCKGWEKIPTQFEKSILMVTLQGPSHSVGWDLLNVCLVFVQRERDDTDASAHTGLDLGNFDCIRGWQMLVFGVRFEIICCRDAQGVATTVFSLQNAIT